MFTYTCQSRNGMDSENANNYILQEKLDSWKHFTQLTAQTRNISCFILLTL
uniref:Uncharacterized protein n=1 Tax=Octopus bimaculoides TaxID=37653 RepID=A0A0L8HZG9_OCTBM